MTIESNPFKNIEIGDLRNLNSKNNEEVIVNLLSHLGEQYEASDLNYSEDEMKTFISEALGLRDEELDLVVPPAFGTTKDVFLGISYIDSRLKPDVLREYSRIPAKIHGDKSIVEMLTEGQFSEVLLRHYELFDAEMSGS